MREIKHSCDIGEIQVLLTAHADEWVDNYGLGCISLSPQSSYSVVFFTILCVLRGNATYQRIGWKNDFINIHVVQIIIIV